MLSKSVFMTSFHTVIFPAGNRSHSHSAFKYSTARSKCQRSYVPTIGLGRNHRQFKRVGNDLGFFCLNQTYTNQFQSKYFALNTWKTKQQKLFISFIYLFQMDLILFPVRQIRQLHWISFVTSSMLNVGYSSHYCLESYKNLSW